MGEACNPRFSSSSNSSRVCTKDAPVPPNVYEGLITKGNPMRCAISFPSKNELAVADGATPMPISIINWRNFSRFSVISIAAISTPIICTPYFFQISISSALMQRLSAVCPPIVGSTASIFCSCNIFTMLWVVSGSK